MEEHREKPIVYPKDVDEILDEHLVRLGRGLYLDPSELDQGSELVNAFEGRMRNLVQAITRTEANKIPDPIYAYLCSNLIFGAFATVQKYKFIIINHGTIPACYDFFERMMGTPGLWPELGDADSNFSGGTSDRIGIKAHAAWSQLPNIQSNNPVRRAMAGVMAADGFDFIVMHELAHIVLGHLDYLSNNSKLNVIDDSNAEADNNTYLLRQIFEISADTNAFLWGMHVLNSMRQPDQSHGNAIDEALEYWHGSPRDAFFHYLLTVFFVFRLFDENIDEEIDLLQRSHPPAPFRFQAVCSSALEHFEKNGQTEHLENLMDALPKVWSVGELLFAQTLGREVDRSGEAFVLSDRAAEHQEKLYNAAMKIPRNLFPQDLSENQ